MWYRLRCFLSNDSAYFILHFWYDLLDMLVLFIYRFNVEHFFYMLKSPSGGACFYSWLRNWISINLLPFKWFQWIFKSALFNWMVKKIYWKKHVIGKYANWIWFPMGFQKKISSWFDETLLSPANILDIAKYFPFPCLFTHAKLRVNFNFIHGLNLAKSQHDEIYWNHAQSENDFG